MTKTYKISEIALLTELPIATLRYYEELDLLKPARNSSNYREFTEADLEWIYFIKRAKATGMPLAKIQDYSRLREQGDSTIIQRISLLVEQERILRQQITDLEGHLDFILQKKHHYYETLQKNSELRFRVFYGVPYRKFLTYLATTGFVGSFECLYFVGYKVIAISFPFFLKR